MRRENKCTSVDEHELEVFFPEASSAKAVSPTPPQELNTGWESCEPND
jgi:hypothetical protein